MNSLAVGEMLIRMSSPSLEIQNLKCVSCQRSESFGFWSMSHFQIRDAQSIKSMPVLQNPKAPEV